MSDLASSSSTDHNHTEHLPDLKALAMTFRQQATTLADQGNKEVARLLIAAAHSLDSAERKWSTELLFAHTKNQTLAHDLEKMKAYVRYTQQKYQRPESDLVSMSL